MYNDMTKDQKLKLIYKHNHADFKGILDGEKSLMMWRDSGSCLVPLSQLTDEEIAKELPYALLKAGNGYRLERA